MVSHTEARNIIASIRYLDHNRLESPLPTFLQQSPFTNINLQFNSFVRCTVLLYRPLVALVIV